jgi:tetratricopeptide (TPR) repeat protein
MTLPQSPPAPLKTVSLFEMARQALNARDGAQALSLISRSIIHEGERNGEALALQGACLREIDAHPAALEAMRAIAPRFPDNGQIQFQHAMAAHDLGLLEEAQAAFERAAALMPGRPEPHMGLADVLLMQGKWDRGWEELEWRYATPDGQKILDQFKDGKRWMGESIKGKRLLVYGEQGFGDSIQFARHLPRLRALDPKEIILGASTELIRLFQGLEGFDRLCVTRLPSDAYDYHTPLSSLPLRLGVTPDTLEKTVPYFRVDPAIREAWRQRLAALPRPRIGLAWAGRPTHPRNHRRSMSLLSFSPLAPLGPFVSVSPLRYSQAELNAAGSTLVIREFGKRLKDFAETAGLLSELDLIISVDTGVAHLAGALGRPLWLLLPFTPDWRWMFGRKDSPWYPTARLYRQPVPRDWTSVLFHVSRDLATFKRDWRPEEST